MKKHPGKKFHGLALRDAKTPITVPLLQVDIDRAEAERSEDPNTVQRLHSCIVAQAVTRVFGENRVAIMRKTAYAAFPGQDHALRFEISDKDSKVVRAFDNGEPVPEGTYITLRPPTKRRQLVTMRKNWQANKEKYSRSKTDRKQRSPDPIDEVIRNGNLVRWSA